MRYVGLLLLLTSLITGAGAFAQSDTTQIGENQIMFLDSVRVEDPSILAEYAPEDLSSMTVVKGKPALAVDPNAHDGIVYIFTKKFARNYVWKVLSERSKEYVAAVPNPHFQQDVVYILNGVPLYENVEFQLSDVNKTNLISVKVIDAKALKKQYKTKGNVGVVVEANIVQ